ncbi:MAG: ABC transporter ATP-binding protein [Fimbriimonadaceae bacterium]
MLEVRELSHEFDGREVLHQIDFTAEKGEIVAIMGSSGGGKTTLLKCMGGLLDPTRGEVLMDELVVAKNMEEARRRMGLVFQYAALFDYLNVFENVAFGVRRQRRLKRNDLEELVAGRLEEVGLKGTEQKLPNELSGGMRKRVGLARALAMEPEYLLYDEPTSGLDPVTAYSIDRLIVDTRDRLKVTSIVVSHDVTSVFRVADRIAFLAAGELVFFGTPEEFREEGHPDVRDLVEKSAAEQFQAELSDTDPLV